MYHIQADMINCKIFFQLMVIVFKEKLNLQLPFVFLTAFTSEQIAEDRFEALLEISDKFTNLMFLATLFCSTGLKQFGKLQNHTV